MSTVISYPIPAYQNVPIEPQNYQPSFFFISNIAFGVTTLVTTTVNHNYVIGQEVRLLIPQANQSIQLSERTGKVIAIPASNQVTLNLNSSKNVDAFVTTTNPNQPQIVAIGDNNSGNISTQGISNVPIGIPGAFINISSGS